PVALLAVTLAVSLGAMTSCAMDDASTAPDGAGLASDEISETPPTTTTPTTIATTPTTVATTPTTLATALPATPSFSSRVRSTSEAELDSSWRSGCPVPVEDLRWLEVTHWDMNNQVADGVLVLHVDHVDAVISVFERLFDARFPIESMRPITDFAADDDASMRANNSSAFNCRLIDGTNRWSQHAYGGAIDINPLVNPWVRGDVVDPPGGAAYVDRTIDEPGLIRAGDVVTDAFAAIGWGWGGDWSSSLDYQHFSHNGR
ncbi:MAG: M15 family metallopeptidase, partial [Actinomycetota bacterium]